jgi:hypothetical protein
MTIFDCCYDLTFSLNREKCFIYIIWTLCLNSWLNCFLIKTFFNLFVMYSSTWNVNVFKVSNVFHVYK